VDPNAQLVNVLQAATVLLLAPLIAGVAARAKAWTESRRGPSILQPYRDLRKLLHKETLRPVGSSRMFVAPLIVAFGIYLVIAIILPIITAYPLPYGSAADFLGGGLLFGLAGTLALLAALDSGSNYAALGASRTVSFAAFAEPTLIVVFFAVAVITGTNNPYVTTDLLAGSAAAYLAPTHLLATAAFLLLLLAETGKLPVESAGLMELGMIEEGRAFEHSGRPLALFHWNGWMKQFLLYAVFLNVFLVPWGFVPGPTPLAAVANIGVLLAKEFGLVGGLVVLEATLAKVRLFKIQDFLALSFSLAVLSVFVFVVLGGP